MILEEARDVLRDMGARISRDGSARCDMPHVRVDRCARQAELEGVFTADQLQAIVLVMRTERRK